MLQVKIQMMEVDDNKHNPESYFSFLVQQVENQSDLCDVTVKLGMWEKKFHRCVLAASPFFETVTNGYCAETQSDIAEIKIDTTPEVLEMALMFLYGIIPTFTINNVGGLLELAEFLLLKCLKSVCINWLNSLDFNKVNCMYVIQLSTKYNFEVTTCIDYIESHLPETFQNSDAWNLSKESVEYLFGNRKFSYVQMDDKLTFLMKWVNMHPSESVENVTALFRTIDMRGVSYSVWENTTRIFPFNEIINSNKIVRLADAEVSRHNILIMSSDKGNFWCLDIEDDRWYQLNSSIFESHRYDKDYPEIAGLRNNLPEIYFTENLDLGYPCTKVSTVNLETDQTHTYTFNLIDEDILNGNIVEEELTNVSFSDDTAVVTVNNKVLVHQISDSAQSASEIDQSPSFPGTNIEVFSISSTDYNTDTVSSVLLGNGRNLESLLSRSSESGSGQNGLVSYAEVYLGHVSEDNIEMSLRIVLANETISQVCLNRLRLIALLTESRKHVIIFDLEHSKTEIIQLVQDENYKIVQTDKGFLIHNDKRCYCFVKLVVPFFSKNHKVEEIKLETEGFWFVQYHYLSGIWIRTIRRNKGDNIELQYVSHEELSVCQPPLSLGINWKKLSVPKEKEIINKLMTGRNMFMVPLSKSKLRCDIACPHCKFLRLVDSCDGEF
ncbi:uncharacterized protein LOC123538305 isoform X2 [Mercenaria mercenaria]|uniref:uncharacterized protein LOC123538305 isoform X2 n=1 Tax=Mercenaria mercenaria TaxID=6596 RepID=UPI00234EC7FF|nr:uncharacterized protein LOC123538305 isoform X2 [Mercenaria mercenaria]